MPCRAKERAVRIAATQLTQRGFPQDNGAGSTQILYHKAVAIWIVIFEYHRAQRRRHAGDVSLILHDHRNAVQRANEARSLERGIEPVGCFESLGVERDD